MLLNLHVKNLALIDEVDVDFSNNLNILTGETGAGKSIILGSIHIALGDKFTKDIVRKGSDYAVVELLFQVENQEIIDKIRKLDIQLEDNQVLISRKYNNGKTISKINGDNVTASTLKEVGSLLIDLHSQHEHQTLLQKSKNLDILDKYCGNEIMELKTALSSVFDEYMKLKKEFDHNTIDEEQKLRQISFLEYEISEIENAKLVTGEDAKLAAEYKRMSNSRQIIEVLDHAYDITGNGNRSMSDEISRVLRGIIQVEEYDEQIKEIREQLEHIENLIIDFNRDISSYISDMSYDELDFKEMEERLDVINGLKSKYGQTINEILSHYNGSKEALQKLQNYEEYNKALQLQCEGKEKKVQEICNKISHIRKKNAVNLTNKIKIALEELNFLQVQFQMQFNKQNQYTKNGVDISEFVISTNLGESLKPLAKVASGGELSRIMLAVKSVLADSDSTPTLIFDEIDVGVSGRTAQKVSEKLSQIARNHQVICITHLPQITAMADNHYLIEKSSNDNKTTTIIKKLEYDQSIEELARLLGGVQITEAVLSNAREMKELAKKF